MFNLFGGGKEIAVSSTVYNMAGEEKDRPQFLKSLILRNILSGTKRSLGETIPNGYLKGPGIKLRSFFRWSERNYDYIGLPTGRMSASAGVNTDEIIEHIAVAEGEKAWVQDAWLEAADFGIWVTKWFLDHPEMDIDLDWTADIDRDTKIITIEFPDGSIHTQWVPDFYPGQKYVFAYYNIVQAAKVGETVIGPPETGNFPPLDGYEVLTDANTIRTETLTTTIQTVITNSDGSPGSTETVTEEEDAEYTVRTRTLRKDTFLGTKPDVAEDQQYSQRLTLNLFENSTVDHVTTVTEEVNDSDPLNIVTTTVTRVREILVEENSYRIDETEIIDKEWSTLKMFVYRIGTGIPKLDSLVTTTENYGSFFPIIPIRLDNKMLSKEFLPETYEVAKKAYRRGTDGAKYDALIEQIAEHENIKDIDYTYVVFGVSLNVIEKSCRKYLYEFFTKMMNDQIGGASLYADHMQFSSQYAGAYALWQIWKQGGGVGPEPILPKKVSLPRSEIRISNDGQVKTNYDIRLAWHYINETINQVGEGRPGAKRGDLWFVDMGTDVWAASVYGTGKTTGGGNGILPSKNARPNNVGKVRLYWQVTDNRYKYIDCVGLSHINYIYGGKTVTISAKEALADPKESGFIVPLHYGTYRAMRLVDGTQMGTACIFLVFNCYVVKKLSFWDSWLFKILLIIVVAVVSVAFTGGAGFGLLGSHLAVGGSFGLSGMAAAIVGSIANSLAALVLTSIISYVSTAVFGEQWGAMIGALISMVVMQSIMNFQMGGQFGFNITDLMRPDNLLKMTDALVTGYQGYVAGDIASMQAETKRLQEQADAELKRIQSAYVTQFGTGGGQIDPMMFVGSNNPVQAESRDTFLTRTLMTGSDIANMSNEMLNDFTGLTLTLTNAFS